MISIKNIKQNSSKSPVGLGRKTVISNDEYRIIVSGGLYPHFKGDFLETFDLMIIDKETKENITNFILETDKKIYSNASYDLIEKIVNKFVRGIYKFE